MSNCEGSRATPQRDEGIYEPTSPERLAEIKRIANADARRILAPVRRLFREIYGKRR